jgi:hypothetical protein
VLPRSIPHCVKARCTPYSRTSSAGERHPLLELRPPPARVPILDRDIKRPPLSHEHDQPLAPGHAGVEEVPRQHGVVLDGEGDDRGRVLGPLCLAHRGRVDQHQLVQLPAAITAFVPRK